MRKLYSLAMEQKEEAKHGETLFPMQKYITRLDQSYPAVTTHWHEEAELTLITSGHCMYQIDLVDYNVREGDILFVSPLLLHSVSLLHSAEMPTEQSFERSSDRSFKTSSEMVSEMEMVSETYVFHLNFLGGNSADICSTRYLVPIMNHEISLPCLITPEHPAYVSILKIFNQIASLYNEEVPGYELAIKSMFLQIVFLLLQYSEKRERQALLEEGTPSDKLKNVLDYIELHYAKPLSVEELAKICCFSEYHFMRFFKKHMNMTCVEYVNNVRLEKAVELFEQGNTSILEVSLSVGFHNLSYFHRAFKKKYGMTPRSFIKEL